MAMLYGLARCDTCRKARAWLEQHGIAHVFIDYREQPVPAGTLREWARQLGWERLVNHSSTTWRALDEAVKSPQSEADWLRLVTAHPTLVRRPVLVLDGGAVHVGFRPDRYAQLFAGAR